MEEMLLFLSLAVMAVCAARVIRKIQARKKAESSKLPEDEIPVTVDEDGEIELPKLTQRTFRRYTISMNGTTKTVDSLDELDPEERKLVEEALKIFAEGRASLGKTSPFFKSKGAKRESSEKDGKKIWN